MTELALARLMEAQQPIHAEVVAVLLAAYVGTVILQAATWATKRIREG